MILNKEYPATHSMDTSWFAIDMEGNVAIFDTGSDGILPVNELCTQQKTLIEILANDLATEDDQGVKSLPLTDAQVDSLINNQNCHNYSIFSFGISYIPENGEKDSSVYIDFQNDSRFFPILNVMIQMDWDILRKQYEEKPVSRDSVLSLTDNEDIIDYLLELQKAKWYINFFFEGCIVLKPDIYFELKQLLLETDDENVILRLSEKKQFYFMKFYAYDSPSAVLKHNDSCIEKSF